MVLVEQAWINVLVKKNMIKHLNIELVWLKTESTCMYTTKIETIPPSIEVDGGGGVGGTGLD